MLLIQLFKNRSESSRTAVPGSGLISPEGLVVVQPVSLTLCDPMGCNTPGCSVLRCLLECAQTHVHQISDATQPSSFSIAPFSSCLQSDYVDNNKKAVLPVLEREQSHLERKPIVWEKVERSRQWSTLFQSSHGKQESRSQREDIQNLMLQHNL